MNTVCSAPLRSRPKNAFFRDIETVGRTLPFASFTTRAVVGFVESYAKAHQRRAVATVLKNLFGVAHYHGIMAANEAAALRLETSRPRDRVWTDDEMARWLEAAGAEDLHMTTAFLLLQFTAAQDDLAAIFRIRSGCG
jgi:hypothetical protein